MCLVYVGGSGHGCFIEAFYDHAVSAICLQSLEIGTE